MPEGDMELYAYNMKSSRQIVKILESEFLETNIQALICLFHKIRGETVSRFFFLKEDLFDVQRVRVYKILKECPKSHVAKLLLKSHGNTTLLTNKHQQILAMRSYRNCSSCIFHISKAVVFPCNMSIVLVKCSEGHCVLLCSHVTC
jgi:hypothetical protein